MSRLVLTGATGFLGQALLDELGPKGELDGTIALCRRAAPELTERGLDVRVGDLGDATWVRAQLPHGCRIIHLAGQVDFTHATVKAMHDLHVEITRVIGHAALAAGCQRFVLLSSSGTTAVSTHPRAADESAPYPLALIANWPYYMSKMLQEKLVLDLYHRRGLPAVILNPSLLLGPGDRPGGSTALVEDFLHGRLLFTPPGGISVVDVRDVAGVTWAALSQGQPGERYLLGGLNCRFATFFELLERISQVKAPMLEAPQRLGLLGAHLLGRAAKRWKPELADALTPSKFQMASHYWYVNWQKASDTFGFHPRPAERTLRDTVNDVRTRAPISV